MKTKLLRGIRGAGGAVCMVILALLVGAILVVISGNHPLEAYGAMLSGAFASKQRISELFVKLIPITIMALGVSIAYKAQMWNIGAEGQFVMGAIASTAVALYVPLPTVLLMPLSLVVAIAAGALWAGFAGWLKVRFHANEVITTLMLNYIATYFLAFLIYGPMMDTEGQLPQSQILPEAVRLNPLMEDLRIHSGIFLLLLVIVLMCFLWKSTLGYRIDLIGQGESVATYAGIHVNRTMVTTMMLSGALAGLAGWIEIFGVQFRLMEGIAGGYGNIATVIALLGGLIPLGIVVSAFFFSILLVGGASMQRMTEVPYSIVDVIQGLIIVFVIARAVFQFSDGKERVKRGKKHA
ncbi:MAG: ABC transporter permease [Oscillospiraceae bacterium]